ncbi:MAG: glycosyltransferase family 2 protein [Planctomycetota bacterium]|nr:MAG: glycosyltransferase family 2 protein [Planctomycetota bacterium]
MTPFSLSVFFPCYNEEENVERVVRDALGVLPECCDEFEIIIVDDGSTDRTGELADRLAAAHEPVRAVHNRPNRGYGGALRRGFAEARKNWIFYTDGDGQFDLAELKRLIPLLRDYDIVSAYRIDRQDPWIRKLNAFGWSTLVNLLFSLGVRDIDCAFKIFPRTLFEQIELKSNSALIDTEVLARAKRLGYRIGQIGVRHLPRTAGVQTGANPRVILRAFCELLQLRKDILRTQPRPAPVE